VWTEELAPGNGAPLAELIGPMRRDGVAAVSPVGVLGDPTTASADDGARIFAEMVDSCLRRIETWSPDGRGMLR
jgi:creatinine amidohydrolase/Fe(II)-dependent formamide hydrolase-like protein